MIVFRSTYMKMYPDSSFCSHIQKVLCINDNTSLETNLDKKTSLDLFQCSTPIPVHDPHIVFNDQPSQSQKEKV